MPQSGHGAPRSGAACRRRVVTRRARRRRCSCPALCGAAPRHRLRRRYRDRSSLRSSWRVESNAISNGVPLKLTLRSRQEPFSVIGDRDSSGPRRSLEGGRRSDTVVDTRLRNASPRSTRHSHWSTRPKRDVPIQARHQRRGVVPTKDKRHPRRSNGSLHSGGRDVEHCFSSS